MTRFLALDPSSTITGYAIFDDGLLTHGTISTKGTPYPQRFVRLESDLEMLLNKYKFTEVCIEGGSYGKFKVSELQVAIKTIKKWCMNRQLGFRDYAPKHIKKIVTGDGTASKDKVGVAVCARYGILGEVTSHETDAIAVGMTHIRRVKDVAT